jgi:hypothetical protein
MLAKPLGMVRAAYQMAGRLGGSSQESEDRSQNEEAEGRMKNAE